MAQGLTELTNRILADARKQVEIVAEESQKEIEQLTEKYEQETAAQIALLQEDYQRRAEEQANRILSRAEMEARLQLLQNKQEMINTAFEQALNILLELPVAEKTPIYRELLLSVVEEGDETIAVSSEERELWTKIVSQVNQDLVKEGRKGKIKIGSEPAAIKGGFLLYSETYEVNASLEALVSDLEERHYPEVAELLFK